MIALLGALLGFFSAGFPTFLNFMKDGRDKLHEIKMMETQAKLQAQYNLQKIEEINLQADIAESAALNDRVKPIGISWVDALNASVRPILTYSLFFLGYIICGKLALLYMLLNPDPSMPWLSMTLGEAVNKLWGVEDQAIFATIIAFWFGSRSFKTFRKT